MLQADILQSSFAKVEPKIHNFATSFYGNLFIKYPEAKPLFANTDMEAQKQKLIDSLKSVMLHIRHGESLALLLRGLGTRHVKYGALPEHYPAVGNALLQTFEEYLGEDWTSEVKQAWIEAYNAITALMLEGAEYTEKEVFLDHFSTTQTENNLTDNIVSFPTQTESNLTENTVSFSTQTESNLTENTVSFPTETEEEEDEDEISDSYYPQKVNNSKEIINSEPSSLGSQIDEDSLRKKRIDWKIIFGASAVIFAGLMAIILPNLLKDNSPSSQPDQSYLISE
jgi:hemoglobin-like flavoprotein